MDLATLVPVGSILPGAIATFFLGLGVGAFASRPVDHLIRVVAVRRAVRATVEAMQAGDTPAAPEGQGNGIPGMPYRRAS